MRSVVLDTGPLGMLVNSKATQLNLAVRQWVKDLLVAGYEVVIPEIADYEVRRELYRIGSSASLRKPDQLRSATGITFAALNSDIMLHAASLWAEARKLGRPTSEPHALDGDVILVATALVRSHWHDDIVVATTNVGHFSQFIQAMLWQDIRP